MNEVWTDDAWEDYVWWQSQDRKTLRRINQLIRDIERDPIDGIGKPEPLRYEYAGLWSRRVDQTNRLVYRATGDSIVIYSCRDHYAR